MSSGLWRRLVLEEAYRRFRGTYLLLHRAGTSETLVISYQAIGRCNPEDRQTFELHILNLLLQQRGSQTVLAWITYILPQGSEVSGENLMIGYVFIQNLK